MEKGKSACLTPFMKGINIKLNDFNIYKSFGDLVEQDVVIIFGIFARKLSIEDGDSVKRYLKCCDAS